MPDLSLRDDAPKASPGQTRHPYRFLRWVMVGLAIAGGTCWLAALFIAEASRKNALLVAAGLLVAAALTSAIIQYRLWHRATHARFAAERAAADQEWEALLREKREQ